MNDDGGAVVVKQVLAGPVADAHQMGEELGLADAVGADENVRQDAGRPVPNTQALREMKLLLLEEGHCFRTQALSFCEVRPEAYRSIMNGSSLTTLVQLVASGVGVTLVPEMAARIETEMAQVCLCHFPPPRPSRDIGMIWRRTNPLEPQFLALSEVIRDAAVWLQEQERDRRS